MATLADLPPELQIRIAQYVALQPKINRAAPRPLPPNMNTEHAASQNSEEQPTSAQPPDSIVKPRLLKSLSCTSKSLRASSARTLFSSIYLANESHLEHFCSTAYSQDRSYVFSHVRRLKLDRPIQTKHIELVKTSFGSRKETKGDSCCSTGKLEHVEEAYQWWYTADMNDMMAPMSGSHKRWMTPQSHANAVHLTAALLGLSGTISATGTCALNHSVTVKGALPFQSTNLEPVTTAEGVAGVRMVHTLVLAGQNLISLYYNHSDGGSGTNSKTLEDALTCLQEDLDLLLLPAPGSASPYVSTTFILDMTTSRSNAARLNSPPDLATLERIGTWAQDRINTIITQGTVPGLEFVLKDSLDHGFRLPPPPPPPP